MVSRRRLAIAELLSRFPKSRPALPEPHQRRYVLDYRQNRLARSGVSRFVAGLEAWMHRAVAAVPGRDILEIGAGTLNHIAFEPGAERYDVVEPFQELWVDSPQRSRVSQFYDDIRTIDVSQRYDKVISVAVLEHLTDLPDVIVNCAIRLAQGGTFAAGFPSEGGLAWYSAWRFGTGTAYRLRTGLSYVPLMKHEHVNQANEIEQVVRRFFRKVHIKRFPVALFQASLYSAITAQDPDLEVCAEWIQARSGL